MTYWFEQNGDTKKAYPADADGVEDNQSDSTSSSTSSDSEEQAEQPVTLAPSVPPGSPNKMIDLDANQVGR